ncbi:hypothetical protein COCCADRAFT_93845 [Bipolaris zeicola 26-R-13]|uniref:Uncharacterized protein n=1 Tax=Cochliobolus carbonum (strain 26-R-13) TaxID=930089 RepID=W6YFQ4_COCC2|nr:uncharacterized protein COCCADRAFT_93845 [Bipolaris zeicola 26-R-13]EUC34279.1 hypothetical protein COCCADRAFT_93845 [Bipolaris zeicola 26-R-13]
MCRKCRDRPSCVESLPGVLSITSSDIRARLTESAWGGVQAMPEAQRSINKSQIDHATRLHVDSN